MLSQAQCQRLESLVYIVLTGYCEPYILTTFQLRLLAWIRLNLPEEGEFVRFWKLFICGKWFFFWVRFKWLFVRFLTFDFACILFKDERFDLVGFMVRFWGGVSWEPGDLGRLRCHGSTCKEHYRCVISHITITLCGKKNNDMVRLVRASECEVDGVDMIIKIPRLQVIKRIALPSG